MPRTAETARTREAKTNIAHSNSEREGGVRAMAGRELGGRERSWGRGGGGEGERGEGFEGCESNSRPRCCVALRVKLGVLRVIEERVSLRQAVPLVGCSVQCAVASFSPVNEALRR